ncbi:MAG: IS110 family transposase [Chloroflexi bacterium]|nr:IS110 family transposase [Chloroflexota bacterium]
MGADALTILNANAAGIDIGLEEMWVSVRADRDPQPLRKFGMNTPDLFTVADWLKVCGVETVAMESTGVYWIPLYEILEARGFRVYLVNARQAKNLPGRKRDEGDAQWLRRLHTFGLLNNSFRPEDEICAVRAYWRHRVDLIEHRAAHIQHMQKALHQMNVRLSPTVTDITGVTGMAIIRAILAGKRDPVHLAQLRNPRCAQPESEFVKALTGNYRDEHVFALKQAVALYDAYTHQLLECDQELERKFSALKPVHDDDLPPLDSTDKRNTHSKNAPAYDGRNLLYHLLGIDLVAVHGLNEVTAQIILSEIGTDMSCWSDEKHFCSWLGLAPHHDVSGGKVLRRRTLKTHNRAGQAFRLAAQAVGKTETAYGAFFRRMRAMHGPRKAIVATAHKIARAVYIMLRDHKPFHALDSDMYNQREKERQIARLYKKATTLGFTLTPVSA